MGCFGRTFGCFGRTTLLITGLIVVGFIIAAVLAPGSDDSQDTNSMLPTSEGVADQINNERQEPASSGSTSQEQASSAAPADYEVVEEELIEPPNQRNRWVVRIRMDPNASAEAKALGIAEAVREADGPGTITIVFAVSGQDTSGFADVGRGYTSDDGQGMAGNGDGLIAEDREGTIQVEVDGELTYFDK